MNGDSESGEVIVSAPGEDSKPMDAPTGEPGENTTPGDLPGLTLDDLTGMHGDAMAGFDPAIHALDADGNPRKKKDGSFASKRGRKPGQREAAQRENTRPNSSGKLPPKNVAESGTVSGDISSVPEVDFKAIAAAAVGTSLGIAVMTFGDEWRPKDKAEYSGLCDATESYFKAKGVQDLPPGWLLLATVTAYSLPRLTAPTTKSRILAGWLRIKGFFHKKKSILAGE